MQLTITLPLSADDRRFLALLIDDSLNETPPAASEQSGGTGTRKRSQKASETPPEVAETPPEPDEALDEALLEEAVKRATRLIRVEKKGAEVKQALDSVGIEKVTHLNSNPKIQAFLEALDSQGV